MNCASSFFRFRVLAIAIVTQFFPTVALSQYICIFSKGSPAASNELPASPYAQQQMLHAHNFLCNRFGCPNYSFARNDNVGNAYAARIQNGYFIRYNDQFMQSQLGVYGSLATIGIFAHELGHIIDFANNPNGNDREATADQYAGCAFALAGAPPHNLTPLINSILSMGGSGPGYPSPTVRAQLIQSGYYACRWG